MLERLRATLVCSAHDFACHGLLQRICLRILEPTWRAGVGNVPFYRAGMTEQRAAAKQATGQPAVRQAFAACNVAYGTSQDQRLVLVRDPPTRTPTPDTRPGRSSFFLASAPDVF